MKFDLKKTLKKIKLNEESISMVLGAIVIVIVGILIVNYFKDKSNGAITDSSTQTASSKEHVVVKGETLWSIAEDSFGSGYNWVDVKSANDLTSETLEIGQKLIIPDVSPREPTATRETTKITQANESVTSNTYTVVSGDNLWDIAVRAYGDGYKWVEIANANSLENPNLIHIGNVLSLPR